MPSIANRTTAQFLICVLVFGGAAAQAAGALPKFMGGSGIGISGNKGNIESRYPSFWDNLMKQQSYYNMYQGVREMAAFRYKDAAQSFAKAVVKNPGEAYPHILLGMALYWQGSVDAAMAEYRAALKLAPDNDEARQLLGIAYAWKGDIKAALEEFEKAVELAPKRADAQMNLGSANAALGNLDETLFRFRNAVNLDKRHPLYQYQLASLYERLGRDSLAEESFKKAIGLYPNYGEALLALAVLYEKMGKNTAAEINYKKALKSKPGDSIARLRLANLLAKENRKDEAADILSRGFLISPLSNEGLGLSIHYNGSADAAARGESGQNDMRLDQFKNRLLKVPPSTRINIEVEMSLSPKLKPQRIDAAPGGDFKQSASALANAVEAGDKEDGTTTFSRAFILAGGTEDERKEQLGKIFEDLKNVQKAAGEQYEITMALRASAPVTDRGVFGAASSGLGPTASLGSPSSKAGYNPYMVGNDMGLWTPNKNWVAYIKDVLPEISRRAEGQNPRDCLVAGLAAITLGQGAQALEAFEKALQTLNGAGPEEAKKLRQITGLGKGTAYIVTGDDAAALKEYKEVLQLNPFNETAKLNIAVLEE
jgi:tetratricopeptide (TPR) repeat protein